MQTTRERRKAKDASSLFSSSTPSSTPSTPQVAAVVRRRKWGTGPFDENWLNLDCCGLVCAFITYCLHGYGIYAVCFILIPAWMSETWEGTRFISLFGHVHRALFCAVAVLACVAHFKAMTTDPGAVPPDASPLETSEESLDEEGGDILISSTHKGKRLCRRCRSFKPQRAHHCSVCRRCIVKMDHHCPWVNNCVGIGNHKYFLLFIFYTFISCIYSMSLVVVRFAVCMHMPHSSVHRRSMHCFDRPTDLLHMLGLVVESLLFGLFTSCMMIDQWDVVNSNVTHIDRLKGDSGGDRVAGLTEVFGLGNYAVSALRWDCLSPFSKVCFPKALHEDIMGFCRPCSNATETHGIEMGAPSVRMVRSVAEIL